MASSPLLFKPAIDKASVIDIVSYGYRQAIVHIKPFSILSIPAILLNIAQAFILPTNSPAPLTSAEHISHGIAQILGGMGGILSLYFYYCVSLYARDVYFNQIDKPLYRYFLIEKKTLAALAAFSLICLLLIIPVGIITFITFVLLIIPGIVWLSYISMIYSMAYALILHQPNGGAKASIREVFRLIKNNANRTIGLGILSWLITFMVSFMLSFSLALTHNLPNQTLNSLSDALSSAACTWFTCGIGSGGCMFMLYRYMADLKLRHGDTDAASLLPVLPDVQAQRSMGG